MHFKALKEEVVKAIKGDCEVITALSLLQNHGIISLDKIWG